MVRPRSGLLAVCSGSRPSGVPQAISCSAIFDPGNRSISGYNFGDEIGERANTELSRAREVTPVRRLHKLVGWDRTVAFRASISKHILPLHFQRL